VKEVLGFNSKGTLLYYLAASEDGLSRFCCAVDLQSGKTTVINGTPGMHSALVNDDGTYILDTYSNLTTPRRTTLMDASGGEKSQLLNAANPLSEYKSCASKIFAIPSKDKSVMLNCRMFFPPAFDSTKQYPVLMYMYGGPHLQMVTNSWLGNADMWLYYMAQQGYVVFTLDNRGSDNRGSDFENAVHRRFGVLEREDQLAGVEFLKDRKYVDQQRMGVFGWSFGGFMSISMMTRTDVFKVGVAGGPVIDWGMYEVMYTERYMDKPAENPEGYKDANLLNYTKNLKGKLLVIHGTVDDLVVWQHSLKYVKKCVDDGVQLDYFVYPGHKHNVTGKDRVHLMTKVAGYFRDNL
jgi:dipeptidyl-peptidase-4